MTAIGDIVEIGIDAIGARGDGVATLDGRRLFVPFAAPGDRLRVRVEADDKDGLRGAIVDRLADGPERRAPLCRHFGDCGGCVAQHLDDSAYVDWKGAVLRDALVRRGIETSIAPLHRISLGTRRRARLKAKRRPDGVALGFFASLSHRVVDLDECPVLVPSLVAILPALRESLAGLLTMGATAEAAITASETGIDLVLDLPQRTDSALLARAAQLAAVVDLARVSFRPMSARRQPGGPLEPAAQRRKVQVRFGGVPVDLPPDAFLQPTEDGERFLSSSVLRSVGESRRVADLYCGCGAFALPLLAAGRQVRAADSAADHVAALDAAARRAGFGAQLRAEARDLGRRPLLGDDLAGLDAVVIDPPRPGAPQQAKALAASAVPTIVYVSCNPASFARDARVLIDGGYSLESVRPLDQFVFSPHLELVGVFRRQRRRR
jgi:23S rRNA (uracil1939-C5)-methyltransferase